MKEELADLLCPSFYKFIELCAPQTDPAPGQLIWAHTVYPPNDPLIVKVLSYNAADPSRSRYEIKRFAKGDQSHFPIPEAQLTFDENYYIYIGKERPLVVVGAIKSRWLNPLKDENLFLCAPVFRFKPKHSDEFKVKCLAFAYPNLFYLPSDANGCAEPGVIRFELIQPISRKALRNFLSGDTLSPVALSDEAFPLFMNHLARWLFKRDLDTVVCQQIDTYKEIVLEELAKQTKSGPS
jgi:hypothetical protein